MSEWINFYNSTASDKPTKSSIILYRRDHAPANTRPAYPALPKNVKLHHKARAFWRSSCSNALDIRSISADRAPTFLATVRHFEVAKATSLIMVLAAGRFRSKYPDAFSRRSREHVPSSRSTLFVSSPSFRSVGVGLRS